MYSGSAEFNNLIDKPGGNAPIKRFTFADFTIEQFAKLEYHGGSNNSDDIAIGTTNMAYLDVSAITDKIITNQEFLFEVGMELSDGTVEYAPMGYFTVQKPSGDEDTVNFKAYDRMQKFEKPYASSLAYPTDSKKVLSELCTMCGVELATPITSPIKITNKLNGYTCREVLGYIAGIHGFFACFDRYGKLNLRWYSETPIEKQIGLIWSLTKSQSNYTIEKITIAKDTETTYTSGTGISGINYSNPYGTQAIADSIYASLGGFTYRSCEISMLDDIRLDPWDVMQVTYLDGTILKIPVMILEHNLTNGESIVKSLGKTDTENEYNYAGPVTQAMERMSTELLVANRIIATKVDAEWVNAHTVTADKLEATNARVDTLEATSLTAETADLRYANITLANIDTANIDVANIGLLFAKVGLIDRATIVDGHITGFLDAVEINANNITAGTLIADRILLKGSEDGLLYALNNLGEVTSTEVDTLDGTILTKRTVTADKLVANSITANELDVENIFANKAVMNELFAQNINATGSITGVKLYGAYAEIDSGKIGNWTIGNNEIYSLSTETDDTEPSIYGIRIMGEDPDYAPNLMMSRCEIGIVDSMVGYALYDSVEGIYGLCSYKGRNVHFESDYNSYTNLLGAATVISENGIGVLCDQLSDGLLIKEWDHKTLATSGYTAKLGTRRFLMRGNGKITIIASGSVAVSDSLEENGSYITNTSISTSGTLSVTGATTLKSTLNVTGITTLSNRLNSSADICLDNSRFYYIRDSGGNARIAITLDANNKYSIATGGVSNTIQLGSSNTTATTIYGVTTFDTTVHCRASIYINDGTSLCARLYKSATGTTSAVGYGQLTLGNSIASGTAGNARGRIELFGTSSGYTMLYPGYAGKSSITINLPSSAGTLALTSSDKRLKENVKDAEVSGLDFINAIKLHQFDWKESGDHWNCGYIADELLEQDKHLVLEGSGGLNDDGTINPLCIDDFYLSAYQTKAIQELYKRIIELEEKIQALKNAN